MKITARESFDLLFSQSKLALEIIIFCLLVIRCGKGFDVKILHEDKRIHIPSFSNSIFSDCRKYGEVGEYRLPMQAYR